MNIFSRFIDIINANMNAMLDKAEDPEKMLRMMIQEMEDTLIDLKSSCAAAMADGAKLEREMKEAHDAAERWQKRALLAVSKGKDDLAREALAEKLQAEKEKTRIEKLLTENKETINNARKNISELEDKLSESKARFRILKEKKERAANEKRARESMNISGLVFREFKMIHPSGSRMIMLRRIQRAYAKNLQTDLLAIISPPLKSHRIW